MSSLIGAIGSSTSHGANRGFLSSGKTEAKKPGTEQVAYMGPSIGSILGNHGGHSSQGSQSTQTAFNA